MNISHVDQIAVTGHILAQQHEMAVPLTTGIRTVMTGTGCNIDLAADDRMNSFFLCGAVEVDDAVHRTVVGDGNGGLPQFGNTVDQSVNAAGAVQQAVFTMYMQMGKVFHSITPLPPPVRRSP